jgi:DNA adenine methylase
MSAAQAGAGDRLRAPFPWFGGKSRVADVVWRAFGDVPNYVEPFAGSLAVLLGRPHAAKTETVNDLDCYLANFWRAAQADPEAVAALADWPVNEADLHARHLWLVQRTEFRERMKTEPDYYDVTVAARWVWGICQWIGSGWCAAACRVAAPSRQLPHLGWGRGVHRRLPRLGDAGSGETLRGYISALADRLRGVRVACGDWARVTGDSVTWRHGTTGVFLDPPYGEGDVDYAADNGVTVWADVAAWAAANGTNPQLRIALCGYEGQPAPAEWTVRAWKAHGGYGSQGDGAARANARRERIWLSSHCLPIDHPQLSLLGPPLPTGIWT